MDEETKLGMLTDSATPKTTTADTSSLAPTTATFAIFEELTTPPKAKYIKSARIWMTDQ